MQNSKILLVSILIFLLGAAIVSTFLSIADIEASNADIIKQLNLRQAAIEIEISKIKPICETLDVLRQERQSIEEQINQAINSPNVKEPRKEAPYESISDLPSKKDGKIETSITSSVDLDKLSRAIAWAETHDCQLGYGKMYANCFGLKNGSIAPCEKIGQNNMCIYDTPEESYQAWKRVWRYGYGNRFPTYRDAQVYTGNDRPDSWLSNVEAKYYE